MEEQKMNTITDLDLNIPSIPNNTNSGPSFSETLNKPWEPADLVNHPHQKMSLKRLK